MSYYRVKNIKAKQELSNNLLAPHAIACWVFVPYLITWQYAVSEGCCTMFHKIIRKTVVMEYFLSNVADLQTYNLTHSD